MKTVVTPVRGRTRSRRSEPPDASLFEALVRSASDLITIHDADGITRYESPAASAVLAYPSGFLVGRNPLVIVHPRDAQRAREAFRTLVNEPDAVRIEQLRVRRADRTWARLEVAGRNLLSDPDVRGIVLTSRSMCPTSRAFDTERDHYAATHDPLTGLPNRTLLVDRVEQAIARAQRHRIQVALMRVNLDGFRLVNETLGRGAGDALLRQVAERLRAATRDGDTIARLEADDFVLLLPDLESTGVAAKVADRVLQWLSQPFGGRGAERYLSASIGVSVFPDDAGHTEGLLDHAAGALTSVKRGGRGSFRFARPQLDGEIRERLVMESTLRQAAERGELILQYQPKYDLGTRQLVGVEALVRWNHPTLGLVPPARFIPLAEETGLIGMVGEWVFRAACAQARRWREAGCRMQVSINVSARQFREPDLANRMLAIMAEIGVDAAGIELELTESVFMEDATRAVSTLERLKAAGVRIAIDDFGTGYSSLSYLQRLPLDVLKIDQSFIQNLSEGPDNAAIVKAVIHMARSLGIEVVAEGVETERHANYLGAWGCTYGQGFFFGRPMAAEDVIARSATAH